jgi:hypothetical protein
LSPPSGTLNMQGGCWLPGRTRPSTVLLKATPLHLWGPHTTKVAHNCLGTLQESGRKRRRPPEFRLWSCTSMLCWSPPPVYLVAASIPQTTSGSWCELAARKRNAAGRR